MCAGPEDLRELRICSNIFREPNDTKKLNSIEVNVKSTNLLFFERKVFFLKTIRS